MSNTDTTIERWAPLVCRDAAGAPLVDPLLVLELGPAVHVVDLRDEAEATGPVGFIPGSVFADGAALDAAAREPGGKPIVLVSIDGSDAAALARRLEAAGAQRVAAMHGGLAAWRGMGFGVSRDPRRLLRDFRPLPKLLDKGERLTVEALRDFLADPRSTHWVLLAALGFHATQSCVDGRDGRGVIGTPGGDAGEFALLLAAVEQVTGESLSEQAIEAALVAHLDAFGDFYLHSDTHALEQLRSELRADGRVAGSVPEGTVPDEWLAFLSHPTPEAREALLTHVGRPDHVGCGHLRLQLEHAEDYGVRAELVGGVIRSFFRLLWAGSPELRPVILEGGHAEGAVLNVVLDHEPWELSQIPVVTPSWRGRQTFINHPDVVRATRATSVRYHARPEGPLAFGPDQVPAVIERLNELGDRQLGVTLSHLASGRGVFQATFSPDGSVEVTQVGQID